MRLDQAIAARNPGLSRRKARELLAANRILVNDRPVRVASREVSDADRITVVEDHPELTILRETSDWVAVDKPPGMPTQPTRDRRNRSLEELLRLRYRDIFLVHRIDTQTSGVVVFAKTRAAAAALSKLFASREIRKTYLAVIEGELDAQTIETPIDGKEALTILRPRGNHVVEAEIKTGRMHQIRIHLSSIGHPVVGDRRYGSPVSAPRMLLHAWKLEHETLGELTAPLPSDFPAL
jgi:23S rRNA pseudouridine1911/1915/1917 synthase